MNINLPTSIASLTMIDVTIGWRHGKSVGVVV